MKRICAGIVLFNPSITRLKENINAIHNQVAQVFLVDNGSENIESIRNLVSKYSKCFLKENINNLGIAKALNQMCLMAYKAKYEWILTLDQDTLCQYNLIELFSKYLNLDKVGIICPNVIYEGLHEKKQNDNSLTSVSDVKACMTSSSLTRISAWKEVKGFRNDYFIDFVDNEFCMKLKIHNYKIIRVNNCFISHQLGETREICLLGKKFYFTKHLPWRYYYMIRNNLVFLREYRKYLRISKEYIKLWYILLLGLFTSNNKKTTLKYIFWGYRDGLRSNMGKLDIK